MLYLPPNLPGSTPRKPEMVRKPTECTVIEDLGPDMEEDIETQNLNSDSTKETSIKDDGS